MRDLDHGLYNLVAIGVKDMPLSITVAEESQLAMAAFGTGYPAL